MKSYTVIYRRDEDGWWAASVRGVRGCRTQGRTIEQARERVREALALFVEDADEAELVDDVKLPPEAKEAMRRYRDARKRADAEQAKARRSARAAVRALTKNARLSLRDAGSLLGLSHQRVQQIVSEK
ncbi:MAG: type II toxin-antitoxin system HicB family antitoxin [Candidatus Methylomirabilis sp.]|nr:type II toxin-antitoxin system HicB family antitoxin [Deltaproteobacteria bacterium]